jgi:hypothetical protein
VGKTKWRPPGGVLSKWRLLRARGPLYCFYAWWFKEWRSRKRAGFWSSQMLILKREAKADISITLLALYINKI